MAMEMEPEFCTGCGEELEEGQIGLCVECRGDDEDKTYEEEEPNELTGDSLEINGEDEEDEEEQGESIVVELKHARARIFLKHVPEGVGYSYDFEYRCGNHSGQCGSRTPPCPVFPSEQDAFVAALHHALRHFDPEKLSAYDSCVSDAQRLVAVEMTERLEKQLALRGVYVTPRTPKSIPAPAHEDALQPSLF